MKSDRIRLILVDPKQELVRAWEDSFRGLPDVEFLRGRFEELPAFDCMVSAANSFGLMDGGVDAAIARFFGPELPRRVQRRILDEFLGEQPVGTSILVPTDHPKHPFVAHTPTMRTPMSIAKTDHVYRAMWAMLLAVHAHNRASTPRIGVVACPGLGTATGRVPASEAARQMALAYRNYLDPPSALDWRVAEDRQAAIRLGGDLGFLLAPEGDGDLS